MDSRQKMRKHMGGKEVSINYIESLGGHESFCNKLKN
jgi:hypothetical protein